MSKSDEHKRQLMFDIDTCVARQIMGSNYRKIYRILDQFLKEYNFKHIQGSGYISIESISDTEISSIATKLIDKYPYLSKCIRDIRVADIICVNSLNSHFDYDGTPGKYTNINLPDIPEKAGKLLHTKGKSI